MTHGHCHVCGMTFRSAIAEARHRHNFPALCRHPKPKKEKKMTKRPMEWHEECLRNMEEHLERAREAQRHEAQRVRQLETAVDLYRAQVMTARERGLGSFDRDRLCKTRR